MTFGCEAEQFLGYYETSPVAGPTYLQHARGSGSFAFFFSQAPLLLM